MLNTAALSKINWTNALALAVSLAAVFGFVIPDEYQKTFLEVTATATPLLTIVLRSFFTGKADQ